ncbi:MAG: 50S ribosomal protein L15 [Candidatus Magasanikbacteria bacterium CG10_big_fil_rev_8_21_14_0_10_40_10]|uniref:Large ribosomal subunit protein uL15 n=1 Tax=Candidatus Magasanikbacteria bacterium CG10_big_fil_rev_8_21_14_0_10_40_10 TaxID=1974648 RepID=A0A2M6W572_9BACT|nr:MAG: 50S ribosomal protein L15 [Candidatus Magasanikbacteria bacterium CG10_big_fil_rev_8_21_14_0_10_40_10]
MPLRPNTIKSKNKLKKRSKRLGRGNASGCGNYSGRGLKGQKSRSGGRRGLKLKGLKAMLQATPKLRGFKSLQTKPTEVSLEKIQKNFKDGETVNLVSLKEKKLVNVKAKEAKILSNGSISIKITVQGIKCTTKAKEMIVKAGGQVE